MALQNYYNRYDPNKHYKELLFIAGRGLQSAELNELQAYIREDLGEIASALIKDGGILSGGGFQYDQNSKQVTLEETKILHKKVYVATAPSAVLQLTGKGRETVGIAVKEKIITELEDPTLRDPAAGFENYNQPGALRKQILARWTTANSVDSDELFYPIYEFIDGVPVTQQKQPPELSGPIQLLARYDYSANGSYVVNGMVVSYDHTDPSTGEIVLNVSEGLAHVEGYEVRFDYARKVRLSPPTDTKTVLAEPLTFTSDGLYRLRNTPIAEILRITGVKQDTAEITHGNYSGAKDKLPKTPVVDVLEVRQGDKVFVEGKDYIVEGDYIDWSLSGDEPAPGSTYTVVYRYQATDVQATVSADRKSIYVSGLAPNTIFYVDYKYHLPRIDRIILTREGDLKVLKGVASERPVAPDVSGGLPLAKVKVFYGQTPEIIPDYYRAFKMSDIQQLFNEIAEIKYNLARLSLIENVRSTDPTTTKKNIFVDPFYDDDLRDFGYEQTAVIANQTLLPGIEWETFQIRKGNPITLPSQPQLTINQDSWSKTRKVNRLTWSEAPPGIMRVSPRLYRWIDRTVWSTTLMPYAWSSTRIIEGTLPRDLEVSVTAERFNGGETVEIYFDGNLVKKVTADESGKVATTIVIPKGTKSGNKQVLAVGTESNVRAESVLSLIALERTIYQVRYIIWNEPLAQTFTLDRDSVIDSVELFFTKKPKPGAFVDVFICETQVGLPDRSKALTRARLYAEDINEGNWTKFVFDDPVILQGGREYALVIETPDSTPEVRVARLGEWDQEHNRWLTSQAYDIGVLLESANSSTWTPIQEEDLAFRLYTKKFEPYAEIDLGTLNLNGATDLVLQVGTQNPPGCFTAFTLTLPDGSTQNIAPYEPLSFNEISGEVSFKAKLSTEDGNLSPIIDGDIYVSVGKVLPESVYISRAFPVDGDTLKVYLEVLETGTQKVKVYCQVGDQWVEMLRSTEGTPTGDGFVEYTFTKSALNVNQTRIKIVLQAKGNERTAARNLRAVVV